MFLLVEPRTKSPEEEAVESINAHLENFTVFFSHKLTNWFNYII